MQAVDVVMYDLLGRKVLTTPEYSGKTIDVSSLSSGTYIMQLVDDENRGISKKNYYRIVTKKPNTHGSQECCPVVLRMRRYFNC
jgi:hypothetical protein